jgi:hypothetical protein
VYATILDIPCCLSVVDCVPDIDPSGRECSCIRGECGAEVSDQLPSSSSGDENRGICMDRGEPPAAEDAGVLGLETINEVRGE